MIRRTREQVSIQFNALKVGGALLAALLAVPAAHWIISRSR